MNTQFIYHKKPDNFFGNILFPLNKLKSINKNVYTSHVQKYDGRETLLTQQIPFLNCLWNDVIHFSVVNPQLIYQELKKNGMKYSKRTFFKIPIHKIEHLPAVYFINTETRLENNIEDICEYKILKHSEYEELKELNKKTKHYYNEKISTGGLPFLYNHLPHVLIKAEIDVESFEEIEWDD